TVECFEAPIAGSIDHTATGTSVNFSSNGGTSGATYTWDFGDGTNGSGATATHKYVDEDGTYTVTLIVSNGCGADTVTTTISVVGIAGVNTNSAKLFPNPTNDITVIRPEKPFVNAQLVIRNASGQVVYVQTGVTGEQVSLSAKALKLASGTYFVECVSA